VWALLLVQAAWGLDLTTTPLDFEGQVRAAAVVGGQIAVAGEDQVDLLSADGVGPLRSWTVAAVDLAGVTLDGAPWAVACGPAGVWLLDPSGGPSVSLTTASCLALADGGVDEVVAADGTLLRRWTSAGDTGGSWVAEDVALVGAPVLATDGLRLAAGVEDGGELLVDEGLSIESLSTTWEVQGLAWVDGSLWAADGATAALLSADGAAVSLVSAPGWLRSGDLDGDGRDELVVDDADHRGVSVLSEGLGRLQWIDDEIILWDLAVGELDDDGCAELLMVETGGGMAVVDAACTDVDDADGDGWSEAEGDCDDGDADRHPGADERCDGIDQDCDGQVDESERIVLDLPHSAAEGSTVQGTAAMEGCTVPAHWVWEVDGAAQGPEGDTAAGSAGDTGAAAAICTTAGASLQCELHDDAVLHVSVAALDADYVLLLEQAQDLTVQNLAPSLLDTGPLSRGIGAGRLVVLPEWTEAEQLAASDAGDDAVRFSLDTELPGISLTTEGLLAIYFGEEGEYPLELMLTDDDGATTALPFILVVSTDIWPGADSGADGSDDTGSWSLDLGVPGCGCGSSYRGDTGPAEDDDDDDHHGSTCVAFIADPVFFFVFFPFSLLWLMVRR